MNQNSTQYLASGDFVMEIVTYSVSADDAERIRELWKTMRNHPTTHWPEQVRVRLFESRYGLPASHRLSLVVEYREDWGANLRLTGSFITYALKRRFNALVEKSSSMIESRQMRLVSIAPGRASARVGRLALKRRGNHAGAEQSATGHDANSAG